MNEHQRANHEAVRDTLCAADLGEPAAVGRDDAAALGREAARQAALAALIARTDALVQEVEFDLARAARDWRRVNVDLRAAPAGLTPAQEAEARRHFENDLRAAEALHAPVAAPGTRRDGDVARAVAPRRMRNLV